MDNSKIKLLTDRLNSVIFGKADTVELAVMTLLAEGHLLIEDVPGVGKTTLASAIAKSVDLSFGRIQFTPDTLPGDVTGYSVADMRTGEMRFIQGPVINNVVLADEINRTSPKTQASLLEVMEERQVTAEGRTIAIQAPFMVIATENPIDFIGTYNLPEAQLDRFLMRISIGYPGQDAEGEMLTAALEGAAVSALEPVLSRQDILDAQSDVRSVRMAQTVRDYILSLVGATRKNDDLTLGASPRATIALAKAAQACAYMAGRDYVIPEDVRRVFRPVLAHRLVLSLDASLKKISVEDVLSACLNGVPMPPVYS